MSARVRPKRAASGIRPYSLLRVGATVAIATVLALTSTVSFAAFTANSAITGAATSTGLRFSTAGLPDLGVIYTKKIKATNAWVTVTNTGSFPLILSAVTVTNSGSEAFGAAVQFGLWADTKCEKKAPGSAFKTSLASGTTALSSSYGFAIPVGGSIQLCSDTQFKGKLKNLAGLKVASSVTLTAAATSGAPSWTTTDASAPVVSLGLIGYAPGSVICAPGVPDISLGEKNSTVLLSWLEPVDKPKNYEVWVDEVLVATLSNKALSIQLDSSLVTATGELEVTIVAVKGDDEYDSDVAYILSTAGATARNLTCA
ncbi:MAG: hypothetical protein Q8M65_05820 [Rhodoglobus sp.]|nr:hypothetical protein [Rhodoglobus sp.]